MTRSPKAGKGAYSLERLAPKAGGSRSDILRSRHPQTINGEGFRHPQGRSEAEDGEAVDGFPTVDRLSVGSGEPAAAGVTLAEVFAMLEKRRLPSTGNRFADLARELDRQGAELERLTSKYRRIQRL